MFKRDSYFFGVIIGLFLPCLFFIVFYFIGILFEGLAVNSKYFTLPSQILLSIAANVIPLRYYFASLKYDRSGRGVLLITFLMVIIYFFLDVDNLLKE